MPRRYLINNGNVFDGSLEDFQCFCQIAAEALVGASPSEKLIEDWCRAKKFSLQIVVIPGPGPQRPYLGWVTEYPDQGMVYVGAADELEAKTSAAQRLQSNKIMVSVREIDANDCAVLAEARGTLLDAVAVLAAANKT